MYKGKRIAVLIAAGGKGCRMGADIPKQYLNIDGVPMVVKSVGAFEENDRVDCIVLVAAADYVCKCKELFAGHLKVKAIVAGGEKRQDSVAQGLNALEQIDYDYVLIHDAARPFVSRRLIDDCIETVLKNRACVAAVPVKDTIRHRNITLSRNELFAVQTPQCFEKSIIKQAYQKAYSDGFYGNDDGELAERAGVQVAIVEGEYANIKITTPEDMPKGNDKMRIGSGFDVHRLAEGRRLVLGGVEIPFEKGLLGHSDADVLTHAVMDALLGAAALGDIGKLFPDSAPEYEGISSIVLLEKVAALLGGFEVENIDATVICEAPKIAPYAEQMKNNIAAALGISSERISIKGTTTEKLGFTGRGEGIAAEAVCLLREK